MLRFATTVTCQEPPQRGWDTRLREVRSFVNGELTRQGLGVYPVLGPAHLPGMEKVEGGGQGGKTGKSGVAQAAHATNHHV